MKTDQLFCQAVNENERRSPSALQKSRERGVGKKELQYFKLYENQREPAKFFK